MTPYPNARFPDDRTDRHLLIGAGPCGLGTARGLAEAGVAYDHVEADDEVGGNWYHGVYPTAHIISSKKITEYPGYPMPAHYPDFPSAADMLAYYVDYARTFGLYDRIEFRTRVDYVRPVADNRWEVTLGTGERRLYAGVLMANGHHWHRRMPTFDGQEGFRGEIIHSKDYKRREQLLDREVVVVGGGNSACDLAAESARLAERAYLSLRGGVWFLPKTFMGKPLSDSPFATWPVWFQRAVTKLVIALVQGPWSDYGLPDPDYRLFEKHPTLGSEVLHYIKHGRLTPKPQIRRLDGDHVEFVDGTRVACDLLACATGYHLSYPFLPPELQRVEGVVAQVYNWSMLDDYRGLYFLGWYQFRGGVGQVFEPYGALVARHIKLQAEITRPLGEVMRERGERIRDTHLVDPYEVIRGIAKQMRRYDELAEFARGYASQLPAYENRPLEAPAEVPALQEVY